MDIELETFFSKPMFTLLANRYNQEMKAQYEKMMILMNNEKARIEEIVKAFSEIKFDLILRRFRLPDETEGEMKEKGKRHGEEQDKKRACSDWCLLI